MFYERVFLPVVKHVDVVSAHKHRRSSKQSLNYLMKPARAFCAAAGGLFSEVYVRFVDHSSKQTLFFMCECKVV